MGFIDDETAIFINKNNYKEKFEEFLSDPENLRWKEIANAGQTYALNNFNNHKATDSLVKLIENII